jgi:membrane protease YdiL (CAAX protease family)
LLVAFKLVVHVALPCLLLAAVGAAPLALFTTTPRGRPFWLTLGVLGPAILILLAVISPSLNQIAALKMAPASLALAGGGAFVWVTIEAGLCEEFLFRAVLQTRLAAALKNEAGAVVVGALVFALVHAPGLYMRGHAGDIGHSQNLIQVIAYTVAVLSPAGLFLGFMWARTRNLLLVVILHALIDVLPFIPVFSQLWF